MQENEQQGLSSISLSRTIEAMAEFWDTHDTADYWEQFEEVEIGVTMKPRHRVVIEDETYARVAEESRRRGIQPETLINLWVAERLHGLAAQRSKQRSRTQGVHNPVAATAKQLAEEGESYSAE
jgi:hypothetical protein